MPLRRGRGNSRAESHRCMHGECGQPTAVSRTANRHLTQIRQALSIQTWLPKPVFLHTLRNVIQSPSWSSRNRSPPSQKPNLASFTFWIDPDLAHFLLLTLGAALLLTLIIFPTLFSVSLLTGPSGGHVYLSAFLLPKGRVPLCLESLLVAQGEVWAPWCCMQGPSRYCRSQPRLLSTQATELLQPRVFAQALPSHAHPQGVPPGPSPHSHLPVAAPAHTLVLLTTYLSISLTSSKCPKAEALISLSL